MKRTYILVFGLAWMACKGPIKENAAVMGAVDDLLPSDTLTCLEIRTYYCHTGKLEDLLTRFEDHTMSLFEKHGMVNLGYWVPLENPENKLVYLMGYPSRTARDTSWEAFMNDPVWQKAWEDSRANGPIVDSVSNRFLRYTDYSPVWEIRAYGPRIFALRTYYTHPGKLGELHARFRDHTLDIFENNGMTNIAYFTPDTPDAGADHTLMYFISFPDTAARKQSWASFGEDPAWKAAYEASVRNGPLVDSITAQLLVPTRFSPLQ